MSKHKYFFLFALAFPFFVASQVETENLSTKKRLLYKKKRILRQKNVAKNSNANELRRQIDDLKKQKEIIKLKKEIEREKQSIKVLESSTDNKEARTSAQAKKKKPYLPQQEIPQFLLKYSFGTLQNKFSFFKLGMEVLMPLNKEGLVLSPGGDF